MEQSQADTGTGWAASSLDRLGEGPGFRKIRPAIGVEEMGVNAIVLPPRYQAGSHWHEKQEEVYFVHEGKVTFLFGDGESCVVSTGGVIRVDAKTHRQVRNEEETTATIVVFGAQGGYIGRDGQPGDASGGFLDA